MKHFTHTNNTNTKADIPADVTVFATMNNVKFDTEPDRRLLNM